MSGQTETIDVALQPWRSPELIRARFVKSATALAAIAKVVEKHPTLARDHRAFLDLFEQSRDFDPKIFGTVWTDPTAYYWVRIAYDLLAHQLSGQALPPLAAAYAAEASADPLGAILADFGRFLLAMNYLADRDYTLAVPVHARLPMALPGTPFSIGTASPEESEISTVSARALARCTEVTHEGCRLRLQPSMFSLRGAEFAQPAVSSSEEFQEKHAPLVKRTLEVIAEFAPLRFEQFKATMQAAALKLRSSGPYTNMSHSHLPGAMIIGVVNDPFELGDTFIHELNHNLLFFIEEQAAFFTDQTEESDERIYSPFRDDLRPIIGLFHAVFVYLPVTEYWFEVLARAGSALSAAQREYAVDRALRAVYQLGIALAQLEKFAHFTEDGLELFRAMQAATLVLKERATAQLPLDAPAKTIRDDGTIEDELSQAKKPVSIRESLLEHLARVDTAKQVVFNF